MDILWISYLKNNTIYNLTRRLNLQIWKDCKSKFKQELNEEEFSAWINPLDFTQYADDNGVQSYYVLAPNDFIKEHIRTNFDDKFRDFLSKASGKSNFT